MREGCRDSPAHETIADFEQLHREAAKAETTVAAMARRYIAAGAKAMGSPIGSGPGFRERTIKRYYGD